MCRYLTPKIKILIIFFTPYQISTYDKYPATENRYFRSFRASSAKYGDARRCPLQPQKPLQNAFINTGARSVTLVIKIEIPLWLERIAVYPLLLYRKLRFGHPFRRIPLTQGKFAIVDPDDYPALAKHKWRLCKTKGKNVLYAERSIRLTNGKYSRLLMHRRLITPPPGYCIDHINRNGLDNRRSNLRLATHAQNAWNTRPRFGSSKFKGICFDKQKRKWRAAIGHNNKRTYLGYFSSERDAAKAYDNAAKIYHASFAALNFPK